MKLLFRKINENDLEMIMKWRTNPNVSKYMYTDFQPNLENQFRWYRKINSDITQKYWVINVDGEDVGVVWLFRIDKVNARCEWGYYLGEPSVRGKGIGKSVELNVLDYVFIIMKLNKLCGEVFLFNEFVINIHKKYGSTVEGTRRQQIFKNGEFHDIVEIGITKEDWESSVKGEIDYTKGTFE